MPPISSMPSVSRAPALLALAALLALTALPGCQGKTAEAEAQPAVGRTAAVKPKKAAGPVNDTGGFCEQTFAAGQKRFTWPPERPLPDGTTPAAPGADRWTWVNVWATWCAPCVEEMGLLGRWTRALQQEGRPIALELLTIDKPEDTDKLRDRMGKGLPGQVRWLRDEPDFGPFLDSIGVDRSAAIPIHALVDPHGDLRCVRVGAISGQDYAAIKSILAGG
ncbi:MAG: hypothetical protein R3F65_04740 [bacterium]